MKKTITLILCLCLLIPFAAMSCSAAGVSLSQGKDALVAQWQKGSSQGFDYRAFSPVTSAEDTTLYPLVILLHGKYSGSYEGEQLTGSGFYKWSSREFQSRFKGSGGAFIIMPRTPGGDTNTWANASYRSKLKALIDAYIADNSKNIDRSRIYLGGWSMGGAGVINMASEYKNFFAALVVMAPFDSISQGQIDAIKKTPTWLITCTKDITASYVTFAAPFWRKLKDTTAVPSYTRLTTFNKYNYYDSGHHYVHRAVADDLLGQPSDCGMHTENAKGSSVAINDSSTLITWLSSQVLGQANEKTCSCQCHDSRGVAKFTWWFKCLFYRIFSPSKRACGCGAMHW